MLRYSQLARIYWINSGSRNDGFILILGCFPARSLKHRGWTKDRLVYVRYLTEPEKQFVNQSMRYEAFRYETLNDLLLDECEVLDRQELELEKKAINERVNSYVVY